MQVPVEPGAARALLVEQAEVGSTQTVETQAGAEVPCKVVAHTWLAVRELQTMTGLEREDLVVVLLVMGTAASAAALAADTPAVAVRQAARVAAAAAPSTAAPTRTTAAVSIQAMVR